MKTSRQFNILYLIIVGWLLVGNVFNSAQAEIELAQKPLYVGMSAAKPNIMLMLDSSGSMDTNVTTTSAISSPSAAPSNFSYNCNKPISGGVTPSIAMIVTSTGTPRFCKSSASCSSSNQTTFSKSKCFNNTKNYNVAYFNGSTLSGGPYTGLQLNWYFSQGSFTAGSLAASTTTTIKRTVIAKQAATDLVAALTPDTGSSATVRMGLARYNGSEGGTLLSEIKDLDSTQSTNLLTQIATIPADGVTPLATTLSDIGKYFATGETGNLTLHPSTTKTTVSVNSLFSKANGTTSRSMNNATGSSLAAGGPILGYCQKSFVILVSDGLPNYDREISPSLRNYTGDCSKIPPLCDSTPTSSTLPGTVLNPSSSPA